MIGCYLCLAAEKPTTVTVGGKEVKEIKSVKILPNGDILIMNPAGGTRARHEDLPEAFLQSWGIDKAKAQEARGDATVKASLAERQAFDRAVETGVFRDIAGTVYDTRKRHPDLIYFNRVRVMQKMPDHFLIDTMPTANPGIITGPVIAVINLPGGELVADREMVSFGGKQVGTFQYRTRSGGLTTVRMYDCGRPCLIASDLPVEIREQGKASGPSTTPADGPKPSSPPDVVSRLPGSERPRGNGTGFFVTEDGYLLTNDHVVRGARRVKLRVSSGLVEAKVVRHDPSNDLALLKAEGTFKWLPMETGRAMRLGESVFTIGFPNVEMQGLAPKYTDGKISSLAGIGDDPRRYQISVPVQPGNSGGPLLDDTGVVIGVVVARLSDMATLQNTGTIPQNVNYAVKASQAKSLMEEVATLSLAKKSASRPLTLDDAIKAAQDATVMVLVY